MILIVRVEFTWSVLAQGSLLTVTWSQWSTQPWSVSSSFRTLNLKWPRPLYDISILTSLYKRPSMETHIDCPYYIAQILGYFVTHFMMID